MNEKIIFIRTIKGDDEARSRTALLSKDIKRALLMVDGTATVGEIMKRSSPSLRDMLEDMFTDLVRSGYIRDKSKAGATLIVPPKPVVSPKKSSNEVDELDFTAAYRLPTAAMLAEEAAKVDLAGKAAAQTEALAASEEKNKLQAEAAQRQAQEAAERQRVEAEAVEKAKMEARLASVEKAKQEAAEKAKMDARLATVEKAKLEAAAEKVRQEAAAEKAKMDARLAAAEKERQEAAAEKVRQEAAAEKAKLEERLAAAEKERKEAAAEKATMEARLAAAEKARVDAEAVAAADKARQEADAVEKAKLEARTAAVEKSRQEARALIEEQAKQAAAEARAQAERLAAEAQEARNKAEREAARAEAEARVRAEAERQAREATETARVALQHAAEVKASAQAAAEQKAALEAEVARLKLKAEEEAFARAESEKQARIEAEAARREVERQAQDARLKAEQESALARAEAEERVRAEAERQAGEMREAARKAAQYAIQAEEQARAAAREKEALKVEVANLKAQAEASVRAEVAAHEKREAERIAREEAQVALVRAEEEARRAREEIDLARQRADAESRAREEAERLAMQAEAVRVQAEKEAVRIAAEALAAAQALAKLASAKAEAERIEKETKARIKAQEEAAKLAAEAHAQEQARLDAVKAEAERIAKEAAARIAAEAARVKPEDSVQDGHLAEDLYLLDGEPSKPYDAYEAQTNSAMLDAIVKLNAKHAAAEESVFSALDVSKTEMDENAVAAGDAVQWALPDASAVIPEKAKIQAVSVASSADVRGVGTGEPVVERRTTTAAVLFFDIVGYTKKSDSRQIELKHQFNQLVSESLDQLGAGERIILDTGDGIAIGFLQHPTDALQTAMIFRNRLMLNKHDDYPDLRARIGIHLGPVSLVKDLNGQINMLGDGINSAQRVMSFASKDQIYVSRAYFDFVSSLSEEYDDLFRYRGSHQDKHGREFQVYELLDASGAADQVVPAEETQIEQSDKLDSFNLDAFDVGLSHPREEEVPPAVDVKSQFSGYMEAADQMHAAAVEPVQAKNVRPEAVAAEAVEILHPDADARPAESVDIHGYSEDEAHILADAQAKKWAEAELRAAENARKKAESANQKIFHPADEGVSAKKPDAKLPRKSIPWGKMGAGLLVLLLAALFVVPVVIPKKAYVANIEKMLAARLQQPVHIGQLSGRILPAPRLVMSDVYIGDAKQIVAKQARVNFSFAALFGKVKSVSTLELDGVQVTGSALPQVALWMQQVADDRKYPVARIVWTKGVLDAEGLPFSDVGGELDFDRAGKFVQAHLSVDGHKIELDIQSAKEGKLQLDITLTDSALPLFPNWVFEDLKATGELTRDELNIVDLEGRIMGGVLTGDVHVNWRTGWHVQGALAARVIPLQNISKLLSGDLDGSAHFQMQSESVAKLAENATLNGVFSVKKGVITGVDIVETTRLRSRESLPGGRTFFDELSGELDYARDIYQFKQLKINNSVVNASGAMTIAAQKLSGSVSSNLTMRAGMGSAVLQIGGTSEAPTLQVSH